jgi:hypothetical protein
MSVTEVTHHSWFSRIFSALKGILIGFVLIPVAIVLLGWNESRSVTTYESLKEGLSVVVSVAPDKVVPENEQKLVHTSGMARTEEVLRDPVFEVSVNALRLRRKVEMYQWREKQERETRKKLGGGTEEVVHYFYEKSWSDSPVKSADFKEPAGHENPPMPHRTEEYISNNAKLGAFRLPAFLLRDLNAFVPLPVSVLPDAGRFRQSLLKMENIIFIGQNPEDPQIGDMRIAFFQVPSDTQASVYAMQSDGGFAPYPTKRGRELSRIEPGVRTAAEMFEAAQAENEMLTWILRVVGFVLMLIGFSLILNPLSVFADVLPFLGNLVGWATGFISFGLAFAISMVVIAVSWIFVRPVLAYGLIGAGLLVFVLAWFARPRRNNADED